MTSLSIGVSLTSVVVRGQGARAPAGTAFLKFTNADGAERVARYTNSDGAERRVLWSPPQ